MVFCSVCHYIPSYLDSLGSKLENLMDKIVVFPGGACRAAYRRLLQWWQSLVLGLKERRAASRDLDILRNFSDAELMDIGLSRNDLMSIKTGEIFRDNSRCKRWR